MASTQSHATDFTKWTDKQLKARFGNCEKREETDLARAIASHMYSRGIANRTHLKVFECNQDSVRSCMRPFMEIASQVKDNQLTAYTEAGGFKIGRPKGHPEKQWIDTYCAIKTPKLKALFGCHVKSPGDEPTFELYLDGTLIASYDADRLDQAFEDWKAVGSLAQ